MAAEPAPPRRAEHLVRAATRPFAQESVARSWAHVATTLSLMLGVLALAVLPAWWPLRVPASVLGGLLMIRSFILYHDHLHGALLPNSRVAHALFWTYGVTALTPPRSWRRSHNHHHAHVGLLAESSVGSFPLMTTHEWRSAGPGARAAYRIARHPLTIVFGYATIFVVNVTLLPLLREPRRHWDSAVSLVVHGALLATLWWALGFAAVVLGVLLPVAVATAFGGYLFHAQHHFRDLHVLPADEWTHDAAALASSSYLRMGPLMHWLTGNIGYHHVHHLNSRIPFYRLPEAMAAIPELRHPRETTLRLRDIRECFRLALWDPARGSLVTLREAA